MRSANCSSSEPSGPSSVISARRKPSNSCSSSLGRTISLARSPCLSAFKLALALPFFDFGPVLFNAFRRFASDCSWLVILESFILFWRSCLMRNFLSSAQSPNAVQIMNINGLIFRYGRTQICEYVRGPSTRDNGHGVLCPSISAF